MPILATLALTACSAPQLKVASFPEGAEVYVVRADHSRAKVGITPITVGSETIPGLIDGSVTIAVSKTGFQDQSVLIPSMSNASRAELFAKLIPLDPPKACENQIAALAETTEGVARAQRLIARKDYLAATQLLLPLAARFPGLPVLFDLLGNSYYLQRDLTGALAAYRKSAELRPENTETKRMIEKISTLRQPAGEAVAPSERQ